MFIGVFVGVNVGVKNDKKWAFPGSFALAGSGCCVIGSQTRRLFSLASRVRMASPLSSLTKIDRIKHLKYMSQK